MYDRGILISGVLDQKVSLDSKDIHKYTLGNIQYNDGNQTYEDTAAKIEPTILPYALSP